MKTDKIVIPNALKKFPNIIYEGHMGVQRCQSLAENTIYWPNLNNDIQNIVGHCEVCLKFRNANQKQEYIPLVNIRWYKLGCYILTFNKLNYLLVVDYYSKYIEIELLNSGY